MQNKIQSSNDQRCSLQPADIKNQSLDKTPDLIKKEPTTLSQMLAVASRQAQRDETRLQEMVEEECERRLKMFVTSLSQRMDCRNQGYVIAFHQECQACLQDVMATRPPVREAEAEHHEQPSTTRQATNNEPGERNDESEVLVSITESEDPKCEPEPSLFGHLPIVDSGEPKQPTDSKPGTPAFRPVTRSYGLNSPTAALANFTTLKSLNLGDDVSKRDPSAFAISSDEDQ